MYIQHNSLKIIHGVSIHKEIRVVSAKSKQERKIEKQQTPGQCGSVQQKQKEDLMQNTSESQQSIYSLNQCLLNAYCVLVTALDVKKTAENHTNFPALMKQVERQGRQTINHR